MTTAELEALAASLPSMGGRQIGPFLRSTAKAAPANTCFVELGCWLGSGTAQMALGLLDRESCDGISIHCFDRWTASDAEVEKASIQGVEITVGANTLPWVQDKLDQFRVPIHYQRGRIDDAVWTGGQISLFVDDATKGGKTAVKALQMFGPSWIPGDTVVVFMDFNFWKKSGEEKHKFHKRLVECYPASFAPIGGALHGSVRAFRYRDSFDFQDTDALNALV